MNTPPSHPDEGSASAGASQAERRWLKRTREQLRAATPEFDEARHWQRMSARVQAEKAWRSLTRRPRVARSSRDVWRALLVYALGAASAAGVILTMIPLPATRVEVVPLGAPAPAAPANMWVFDVVFRDEATAAQIRAALQDAGAEVVGGPSALGVWRVAVPAERAAQARQRLAAQPAVESVSEATP